MTTDDRGIPWLFSEAAAAEREAAARMGDAHYLEVVEDHVRRAVEMEHGNNE